MRLSQYPYVVVRIGCSHCARRGSYRLARLADRYGSEIEMARLLDHLAGDCGKRDRSIRNFEYCGTFYPDIGGARPPDEPQGMVRLRIVK